MFKKRSAPSTLKKKVDSPPPSPSHDSQSDTEDPTTVSTKRTANFHSNQTHSSKRVKNTDEYHDIAVRATGKGLTTGSATKAFIVDGGGGKGIMGRRDDENDTNQIEIQGGGSVTIKKQDRPTNGISNAKKSLMKDDTRTATTAEDTVDKAAPTSNIKIGPLRATTNVRISCRFDYQPDVCKDYKETGYCGYGDSCKFLHDRGDFKTGWQLDQEWDKLQKEKLKNRQVDEDGNIIMEPEVTEPAKPELPFACYICREPFKQPVVTKCEHYFCQNCAIANFKKSPKCAVCGVNTDGVFKPAKKILEAAEQAAAA